MAVTVITTEMLYRMHRLKRELEGKKAAPKKRRSKWAYAAAAVAAVCLVVWG